MQQRIIYPRPQWLREKPGEAFPLAPDTPILAPPASRPEAEHLQRWLKADYGLDIPIEAPAEGKAGILVGRLGDQAVRRTLERHAIPTGEREAVPEGYLLHAASDHALVTGHDAAGTFYGLQLLRQLIARDGSGLRVLGAEAHDWPYKGLRGVHLYMPGRENLPFFGRFLEFLASLRFNTLFLEVGGGMRYDRHPEINRGWEAFCATLRALPEGPESIQHAYPFPKDSTHTELGRGSCLEKDEVRAILAQARSLHIEVIPEVQALSHAYYLCCSHPEIAERQDDPFPDTYCPSNPASYELLFDVMDEVIEVFQPRVMHTGHDEAYTYALCPRCRDKSGAELIAGDLIKIHDYLAGKGVRMAMWGDKLMNIIVGGKAEGGREIRVPAGTWFNSTQEYVMAETYQAVDVVPKDILILDWYWKYDPASQEYFIGQGFQELFGNFGRNFMAHRFWGWDTKSASPDMLGAEVSTWCEVSEFALGRNACLFNMMVSAEMLWWSHYSDRERERLLWTVAGLQPRVRDRLGERRSPSLAPAPRYSCYPLPGSGEAPCAEEPCQEVDPEGAPYILGAGLAASKAAPEATPVPVGEAVDSLLFLHNCRCERPFRATWSFRDPLRPSPEDLLGWYEVLYADGSQEAVEIRFGENIANAHLRFGEDVTACCYWAEPAWEGRDEGGRPITLYRYEWINPHPGKEISSVRLRLAGAEGEIHLLALTGVRAAR